MKREYKIVIAFYDQSCRSLSKGDCGLQLALLLMMMIIAPNSCACKERGRSKNGQSFNDCPCPFFELKIWWWLVSCEKSVQWRTSFLHRLTVILSKKLFRHSTDISREINHPTVLSFYCAFSRLQSRKYAACVSSGD